MEEYIIKIPLQDLFLNINKEDCKNLIKEKDLKFNVTLRNPLLINNKFYYRNFSVTDKTKYETNNNPNDYIEIGEISFHGKSIDIPKDYIEKCKRSYKKRNVLPERIHKINNEIRRVDELVFKIKTEVIYNLNFSKGRGASHYCNVENKITGVNKYIKSLFLYDLNLITDSLKIKLINYINNCLKIYIDDNATLEEIFIYFALCNILKNIEHYKNYLNECIKQINADLFNLNKQYCMFSDIVEDRIIENDKEFVKYLKNHIYLKTIMYTRLIIKINVSVQGMF